MRTSSIFFIATLSVALMSCDAENPHSTSAQPQMEAAHPAETSLHHETHDAEEPSHDEPTVEHHHDEMHSMLRLDQGQRWIPDAPLVQGMERIRIAVNDAAALPELDAGAAEALAQLVKEQVNFLIANCNLEPDADATLHVFIAQLLKASAALEQDPSSPLGIPQMQQSLNEYARYFAHPGWESKAISDN